MHKSDSKKESNKATLAHVMKEMDEPLMAESTRDDLGPDHGQEQARVTSFEEVIELLGIQPCDFAASTALKEWVTRNRDRRYVPSDLLKAWGLEVDAGF